MVDTRSSAYLQSRDVSANGGKRGNLILLVEPLLHQSSHQWREFQIVRSKLKLYKPFTVPVRSQSINGSYPVPSISPQTTFPRLAGLSTQQQLWRIHTALTWYALRTKSNPEELKDCDTFAREIRTRFEDRNHSMNALRKVRDLKYKRGSIKKYNDIFATMYGTVKT